MPEIRQRMRQELGFGPEDVVVGNIGRLHYSKGVLTLLDGFEQLRVHRPWLKLVLAGPGPLRERIVERTRSYAGQVRLLDPLPYDRVPEVLNALDIFALPSFGEAFGISLLEAMACGVPGVALSRWGVKELVRDGETGFLASSAAEFMSRLEQLGRDAGLREKLGQAAKRCAERFSWRSVAEQTVAFYRELIDRKSRQ
jgi:glycosyltransferase involved in cell wall biosynthesis